MTILQGFVEIADNQLVMLDLKKKIVGNVINGVKTVKNTKYNPVKNIFF